MPNLSALATATTAAQSLSNLILVNPQVDVGIQPQGSAQVGAAPSQQSPTFLFDYHGEDQVIVESDITDHFIEDNTAIQDQIALKPEMYVVHGFVGELNDIVPKALQPLQVAAQRLLLLGAYTPALTAAAVLAYNQAVQLYSIAALTAGAAVSAWGAVSGGNSNPTQNKQQTAFQTLYGYYRKRTLFTVQTPWCIWKNMAIKSMRTIQDGESRMVSDFEITFKMIRFANTTTVGGSPLNNFSGRASADAAASSPVPLGASNPVPVTTSFLGSVP